MTKIELLKSLGRLSLIDYYTIPRYKRITILQQGMAVMVIKLQVYTSFVFNLYRVFTIDFRLETTMVGN